MKVIDSILFFAHMFLVYFILITGSAVLGLAGVWSNPAPVLSCLALSFLITRAVGGVPWKKG